MRTVLRLSIGRLVDLGSWAGKSMLQL